MLTVILLLIVLVCLGALGTDGLWHNIISFFNTLMAAILATNLWEPASAWLDYKMPSYTFLIDMVIMWGIFGIFAIAFRFITGRLSKTRVLFYKPVDIAGGFIVSLFTAWVLISFSMMSLHTAALPAHGFGGKFQPTPESRMFFDLAPDRKWLAFMHKLSTESFSRPAPLEEPNKYAFDPKAEFILTYYGRRKQLESTRNLRVLREWGSGKIGQ